MQLSFSAPSTAGTGALVVAALEGGAFTAAAAEADRKTAGALKRALDASRFSGKAGQLLEVLAPAGMKASRILLVGLGKPSQFDRPQAEELAAGVVGRLLASGETSVTFAIDLPKGSKMKADSLAAHLAMGVKLRSYTFHHYRTKGLDEITPTLKKAAIGTSDVAGARKSWQALSAIAEGMFLARDLVNEPPNVLYPVEFARRTRALVKLGVKVEVLGAAQMKKLGLNALLGVGQGSVRESQLAIIDSWPGIDGLHLSVAHVGHGIMSSPAGGEIIAAKVLELPLPDPVFGQFGLDVPWVEHDSGGISAHEALPA